MDLSYVILEAAKAELASTAVVHGTSDFKVSSNLIAWDYKAVQMTEGATNFGMPIQTTGNSKSYMFGQEMLSLFDLAIVYMTCKCIAAASASTGKPLETEEAASSNESVKATWFGNSLLISSIDRKLVTHIEPGELVRLIQRQCFSVANFIKSESFRIGLNGTLVTLDTSDGESIATIGLAKHIIEQYRAVLCPVNRFPVVDDPTTEVDETSELGALLSAIEVDTNINAIFEQYAQIKRKDGENIRTDLIFNEPSVYQSADNMFGSICYTDHDEAQVGVTLRNGMFVGRPWFKERGVDPKVLKVNTDPDLHKFRDITDACIHIGHFAQSLNRSAPNLAEFDLITFKKIQDAFIAMRLVRLPAAETFGRLVISEKALQRELNNVPNNDLICYLPVGIINRRLVVKDSMGNLALLPVSEDLTNTYFYDITTIIDGMGEYS